MEPGFIVTVLIAVIVGITIGVLIGKSKNVHSGSQGILNVDCSDPEYGPGMYLQLVVPIEDVISQKQVTFSVNVIRYNSQE